MTRIISILLTGMILTVGCKGSNLHEKSLSGLHQTEIEEMLGKPDTTKEIVKSREPIWGPIENIWHKLETGEKAVIWTYQTRKGRKELYFLNDSTEVVFEFFWYKDPKKNPVF